LNKTQEDGRLVGQGTIDTLIRVSLAAADEIIAVYSDPVFARWLKDDSSPVTEADMRAEALIINALRDEYPEIPIVSEEMAAAGNLPPTGDRFFLVDPLDGTKEFLSRNGEFTVNIALIEFGAPIMGVVCAPARGELFVGEGSRALWGRVADGVAKDLVQITTRKAPRYLTAVGSRSHGSHETTAWLQRFNIGQFISVGSSLKLCLVAAGQADIYPRLGRTMEWDTAAGDAILRAAGGIVVTFDGHPLIYNKRHRSGADFANGHFVAYGDPNLLTSKKSESRSSP
jgi:3'(2'), 5'-bisphosphate nucleotidase